MMGEEMIKWDTRKTLKHIKLERRDENDGFW